MRGIPSIVVVLVVAWILGWLVFKIAGFAIHLLLLGALVFGIVWLVRKGLESRTPRG